MRPRHKDGVATDRVSDVKHALPVNARQYQHANNGCQLYPAETNNNETQS